MTTAESESGSKRLLPVFRSENSARLFVNSSSTRLNISGNQIACICLTPTALVDFLKKLKSSSDPPSGVVFEPLDLKPGVSIEVWPVDQVIREAMKMTPPKN